jgi:hypothetical protein
LEGNKMAERIVTLPSGATVTIRDPKELRVKDRKKIYANAAKADEGIMQALSLTDGLLAVLIKEWSFDLIIPSIRITTLEELEMADYDFLTEETKDAQKILFPNLSKTDETEKDPESPFDNSND